MNYSAIFLNGIMTILILLTKLSVFVQSFSGNNHFIGFGNNHKDSMINVHKLVKQQKSYCYLSTLHYTNKLNGFPYTSIVGFTVDELGNPIISMSDISQHTRNIGKDNRISILIPDNNVNPTDLKLNQQRVTLIGNLEKVSGADKNYYKDIYRKSHDEAFWVDFSDFNFYKLDKIKDITYIGGFGKATKINVAKYYETF